MNAFNKVNYVIEPCDRGAAKTVHVERLKKNNNCEPIDAAPLADAEAQVVDSSLSEDTDQAEEVVPSVPDAVRGVPGLRVTRSGRPVRLPARLLADSE